MARAQGHRPKVGAGRRLAVVAIAVIVGASSGCGLLGDDDASPDDEVVEAVTVALEAVGTDGDDPFFDSIAISETTLPERIATAAIDGILTNASDDTAPVIVGDTPGLFGGTRDQSTCDVPRLTDYLTDPANAEKAEAFAVALGMTVADIPEVLAGYTPVTLTLDTLVTNHGYADGEATPFPAVLQAGTAVLVDTTGLPRVKCSCGNPLTPPTAARHLTTTTVTGTPWRGWTPSTTAQVRAASAPLTDLTLTDTTTGETFIVPIGSERPPDDTTPATTTTTTTTTTEAPPPTTAAPPPTTTPTGPPDVDLGSLPAGLCEDGAGAFHNPDAPGQTTAEMDVDGDGSLELLAVVICSPGGSSYVWFLVVAFGEGGAVVGSPLRFTTPTPGWAQSVISSIRVDGNTLVIDGLDFADNDAHCCPSVASTTRWQPSGGSWQRIG